MKWLARVLILVCIFGGGVTSAEERKVRQLYEEGKRAYQRAQYDQAAAKFEEAAKLEPWPALFYDLGKAHQKAGHPEQAIENYRKYIIREPTKPEAALAKEAIRELQAAIEEHQAAAAKDAAPAPATGAMQERPVAAPLVPKLLDETKAGVAEGSQRPAKSKKMWPVWVGVAAGVAAAALAVGLGVGLSQGHDTELPFHNVP